MLIRLFMAQRRTRSVGRGSLDALDVTNANTECRLTERCLAMSLSDATRDRSSFRRSVT